MELYCRPKAFKFADSGTDKYESINPIIDQSNIRITRSSSDTTISMLDERDVTWTHLVADAVSGFVGVIGPVHLTAGVSFCDCGLYQLMSQCWRRRAGWQWRGRGGWRGLMVGRLSVASEKIKKARKWLNKIQCIWIWKAFCAYRGGTIYKSNTNTYLGGSFRNLLGEYRNRLTWSCVLCGSPSCCWRWGAVWAC